MRNEATSGSSLNHALRRCKTIRGKGHRFIVPVDVDADEAAGPPKVPPADVAPRVAVWRHRRCGLHHTGSHAVCESALSRGESLTAG